MDFDGHSTIELRLPSGEPVTICVRHIVALEPSQNAGSAITTTYGPVTVTDAYDVVRALLLRPGARHYSTPATPAQCQQTTGDARDS